VVVVVVVMLLVLELEAQEEGDITVFRGHLEPLDKVMLVEMVLEEEAAVVELVELVGMVLPQMEALEVLAKHQLFVTAQV
tara:strand:+ start:351 stop:590 length:240 start_codon:yes stop_codon:yes gene_type:complete